jgi:pimeloyl-ACP methyl ester carboxylesterase
MNDKPGSLPTRTDVVVSADGTAISYRTLGKGPAVLDVPGALAVATDFDALARELADRFTVHTIERRGRGESGPQLVRNRPPPLVRTSFADSITSIGSG